MTEAYKQPTDWRGLCEELLRELENCIAVHYGEGGTHHISAADAVIAKVDAALAQSEPEVEGPSDEELLDVASQAIEPYDQICVDEYEAENNCALEVYSSELIAFARAVLSRWGRHAPAPAGEVAELVAWLRDRAAVNERFSAPQAAAQLTRAADLLERQAVPVPVAVSERSEQIEDLAADAVGALRYIEQTHCRLYGVGWDRVYEKAERLGPANALPLPSGEAHA